MARTLFIIGLLGLTGVSATNPFHHPTNQKSYAVVPGIFQQDDPATNASTFNFIATNFGLIDRTYHSDHSCPSGSESTQWQRLAHYIATLNRESPASVRHVLLFLARHGEGFHNAAESYFGTPAWNCYWSELDGNGTVTWADARLTETGTNQALRVNQFWKGLIEQEKIATPQVYYTSPLTRCLTTAKLTFEGLHLPGHKPFIPIVKEGFREGISAHTCDRRRSKSQIHAEFPYYRFERGFSEDDQLWHALRAETNQAQDARSKAALDDVLGVGRTTVISVTSHSGEIASLLRVLGHRVFPLSTGAALPVLVKVTMTDEKTPTTIVQSPTPVSTCAVPPTIRDSSCNDCSCCK